MWFGLGWYTHSCVTCHNHSLFVPCSKIPPFETLAGTPNRHHGRKHRANTLATVYKGWWISKDWMQFVNIGRIRIKHHNTNTRPQIKQILYLSKKKCWFGSVEKNDCCMSQLNHGVGTNCQGHGSGRSFDTSGISQTYESKMISPYSYPRPPI